jgi:DNA-binding NtrC family response regulator
MQRVYDLITRVASTELTVLVTGESGTGKELVARTLHELGPRRAGPFVAVNCGAVPANLIESELFGHERGAFTGATQQHRGMFERASGGTLFLDEIVEMPLELQPRLLRVLETGTLLRVGGEEPVPVDVRLVAATNRSPEAAVREGRLREDLYYRLHVFPVALPPLRERGGDVALIAQHVLDGLNREAGTSKPLSDRARAALERHRWPGNVRELRHALQRGFVLAEDEVELDLPIPVATGAPGAAGVETVHVGLTLEEVERRLILATLEQCGGDKRKAAATLGISLKTLYNRLNLYAARAGGAGRS